MVRSVNVAPIHLIAQVDAALITSKPHRKCRVNDTLH